MKARVVVVDDEENIRFTFKEFLSEEGHDVVTYTDFESAIQGLSENDSDVIFLDIILNNHSGIDILNHIKTNQMLCPVIMITGQPNLESAAASVRLGAFDYLTKPIYKEKLLNVMSHALRHKRLLDENKRILKEKEQYRCNLEAIFRSVKDGIITVDQDMQVIEANESFGKICGLNPQEIQGKSMIETNKNCNEKCHEVLLETLKIKKNVKEYRIECEKMNRDEQVVVLSSSPLMDVQNQFSGAVLVVRDITKLEDLEKELMERNQYHNIIGQSKKMQEIYNLLENLLHTETTVLITGESGTGKELVANALHYGGNRSFKSFVKVNCSALSENLLESELFGHVRGAFTGAIKDKKGRFEIANEGTLLLDEVGDISPRIQLKLLRVLQEKEIERVGESKSIKVNVRVIASTNSDLQEKVRKKEFREDLYYRLKVVEIKLPSLYERREDIHLLVDHFCKKFMQKFKKNIEGISDEVLKLFMEYSWPGNIRELEHTLEHGFVLCHERTITLDHLPIDMRSKLETASSKVMDHQYDERLRILHVLKKAGWNKAKAARQLGMSRQHLYRKLNQYQLNEPSI